MLVSRWRCGAADETVPQLKRTVIRTTTCPLPSMGASEDRLSSIAGPFHPPAEFCPRRTQRAEVLGLLGREGDQGEPTMI
jgi:hypothetical protein